MKKHQLIIAFSVLMAATITFTSCAKAPTEKLKSLKTEVENLNKPAAEYFATDEYKILLKHLEEIDICMKEKEYRQANAFADSASQALKTIRSILNEKSGLLATASLENARDKLDTLLTHLNDNYDTLKRLKRLELFEEKYQSYAKRISDLDTDLFNSRYLRVHKNAIKMSEEIDATKQRVNKLISQK